MRGMYRWIGSSFAVVSATVVTTGLAISKARAAEPLLEWSMVHNVVWAAEQGPLIGGGRVTAHAPLELQELGSALPPPPTAFARQPADQSFNAAGTGVGRMSAFVSPSLSGLSASVVPAVTGDLIPERKQIALRAVSSSFGQVSGLRLYRPKVGASVGVTSPDFVGVK